MIRQDIKEIAPATWWISEFGLVNAFVVEGEEQCAIIDTGCGYGNIRVVAESVTKKPFIVLMTHAHPDHDGGIYHFKDCQIYMNDDDRSLLETNVFGLGSGNSFRRTYIETRGPARCPDIMDEVEKTIPADNPDCNFQSINVDDGDVINLGGRTLECIHTPGHSEGSVCYLDGNTRILFSGDTVNNSIILTRLPDNNPSLIEKYHKTLEKLWSREKDFDVLAIGHGGPLIDKSIIHDYLQLTGGLLDGGMTGMYEESGFRKGDVARFGKAELWYHCDA